MFYFVVSRLLIPGGKLSLTSSEYAKAGMKFIRLALDVSLSIFLAHDIRTNFPEESENCYLRKCLRYFKHYRPRKEGIIFQYGGRVLDRNFLYKRLLAAKLCTLSVTQRTCNYHCTCCLVRFNI